MQWDDTGYLLSKNRYNENSIIAEFFTENHGKCTGIIFGATSKKIKSYLEIGNKIFINYNFKNEGKMGYFKVEISKANSAFFFNYQKKLFSISSAMSLIRLLTVEFQENKKIYNLIDNFFILLNNNNNYNWVKEYIFWELKLLELVGFKLELKKISQSETLNNKKKYFVKSNTGKKYIPNFLIDRIDDNIDKTILLNGLKLVGDFLEKNILKPNNINYPTTRLEFVKLFK